MLKKAISIFLALAIAVCFVGCGKDEKTESTRLTILKNAADVTAYHSQISLNVDDLTRNIEVDHDEESGNTRLKQEEGGETVHVLRVNGQDMVSTDGVAYQSVDKQSITVIRYADVAQILDSPLYKASEDGKTLVFEGFDQTIFDNLTYAYSIKFQGFVPDEEAKQTNKDIFNIKIIVTPNKSGEYIKRMEAAIRAQSGTNKEAVAIVTDFSDYNDIEPITKPK